VRRTSFLIFCSREHTTNMAKLPRDFMKEMYECLQEEADDFFASYDQPRTSGIRANGLKLASARLLELTGAARVPIPWADGGFYTDEEERPGKHPYYHLGLYYIQEPSAMLPAELLDVRPGHRVLDLCAAPGGKTTQIAAKLQGEGVLVTNDNAADRVKALVKNVELSGVRNAVVLNEEPSRIAEIFGNWFDRVLVDAPCSGEGMFRKDEEMARQWERRSAGEYVRMQRDILAQAARMVVPGGQLVYSTCTFSPRENEGVVAGFLAAHEDFSVVSPGSGYEFGLSPGRPDWLTEDERAGLTDARRDSLAGAVRVWPHRSRGEGHFAIVLARSGKVETDGDRIDVGEQAYDRTASGSNPKRHRAGQRDNEHELEALRKFEAFRADILPEWQPPGKLAMRGDTVYAQPFPLPDLGDLRTVRLGWQLGIAGKHRFEPSQALAMGLKPDDAQRQRTLYIDSAYADCLRYLKGETLQPDPGSLTGKGWTLVCIDGFPAGWGRWDGMTLKNERLPGWRWM